jgi:hypothetical protein
MYFLGQGRAGRNQIVGNIWFYRHNSVPLNYGLLTINGSQTVPNVIQDSSRWIYMNTERFAIADEVWAMISPHFSGKVTDFGVTAADNRLFLGAMRAYGVDEAVTNLIDVMDREAEHTEN